jgi:hypothetical protein
VWPYRVVACVHRVWHTPPCRSGSGNLPLWSWCYQFVFHVFWQVLFDSHEVNVEFDVNMQVHYNENLRKLIGLYLNIFPIIAPGNFLIFSVEWKYQHVDLKKSFKVLKSFKEL